MSGAFGWINNDKDVYRPPTRQTDSGFTQAVNRYRKPAPSTPKPSRRASTPTSPPASVPRKLSKAKVKANLPIPRANHDLKSTASNVIIFVQDTTVSMSDKPDEIFRRLPRLYYDACKYLGTDDLEILFIVHGDSRTDSHPIQVARFGREQELDEHLASFYTRHGGGGQGTESQELVAYYILKRIDTSSAKHVYTFFVTDEAAEDVVRDRFVERDLGLSLDPDFARTRAVFDALMTRMNVYCVLFDPTMYEPEPIRRWWERTLAPEGILELNDPRRIVDVILGTLAVETGQYDTFMADLKSRQLPTTHGAINVSTVQKSISLISQGSASKPLLPKATTKPLLPSHFSVADDGSDD